MGGINDASLFPDLIRPTVPIDQATDVLRQPIQPPADPASYQQSLDTQHFRANLPTFLNEFMDTLSAHRQQAAQQQADDEAASQQAQAEQQQQAQLDAENAALAQQAEQQQQDQVNAVPASPATRAASLLPAGDPMAQPLGQDPFAAEQVAGEIAQQQHDAADPELQAIQQATGGQPGGISQDLHQVTLPPNIAAKDVQPLLDYTIEQAGNAPSQAERDYYKNAYVKLAGQLSPDTLTETVRNRAGRSGMTLEDALGLISKAGGYVGERVGKVGTTAALGPLNLVPGVTDKAQDIGGAVGEKVGEFAAPAVADIATGGMLTAPFMYSGATQLIQIGNAYKNGEISGQDALKQVGLIAPQFLPIVLHGVGALSDFARSDAGQRIITKLSEEGPPKVSPEMNDLLANKAEVRTLGPEELQREAANRGLMKSQEELGNEQIVADAVARADARRAGAAAAAATEPTTANAGLTAEGTVVPVRVAGNANIAPRSTVDAVKTELGLSDTPDDMARLASELEQRGYDGADISSGFGDVTQRRIVLFKPQLAEPLAEGAVAPEGDHTFYHGTTPEGAAGIRSEGMIRPTAAATGTLPGTYLHETPEMARVSARTSARLNELGANRQPQGGIISSSRGPEAVAAGERGAITPFGANRGADSVNLPQPKGLDAPSEVDITSQIKQQEQYLGGLDAQLDRLLASGEYTDTDPVIQSLSAHADAVSRNLDQLYEQLNSVRDAAIKEMSTEELIQRVRGEDAAVQQGVRQQTPGLNPNEKSPYQSALEQRFREGDPQAEAYYRGALQEIEPPAQEAAREAAVESADPAPVTQATAQAAAEAPTPEAATEAVAATPASQQLPDEVAAALNAASKRMRDLGNTEAADAIDALNSSLGTQDATAVALGQAPAGTAAPGAAGAGAGGAGTTPTTRSTAGRGKVQPSAKTERMGAFNKVVREVVRQFGVEHGDPKPIRDLITNHARNLVARLNEADHMGRQWADRIRTLGDLEIDPANMPDTARAVLRENPDAALAMAISNPYQFRLTPEQTKFVEDFTKTTDSIKKRLLKAGVKVGEQSDDQNYFPRITLDVDGRPVVTAASTFTHGRTAGSLEEALSSGVNYVMDPALALQAHMEAAALTEANAGLTLRLSKMADFDGDGKPLWYGARGARDGYTPVDNMGRETRGRMWQARDGRVHELLTNTFSTGLDDVARLATLPSRLSRSIQFSFGLFHAGFGNLSLMFGDPIAFVRNLPEQMGAFTEAGRAAGRDGNYGYRALFQKGGGQLSDIDRFGSARRDIRQGQGMPEATNLLNKRVTIPEAVPGVGGKRVPVAPGLGKLSEANHRWLFEGIMPNVQIALFKSHLRWLAAHKPDIMPGELADVVESGDIGRIDKMLADNPEFASQLQRIVARSNHPMGFTESTLGAGERGLSQFWLNTPTITRAIAANVRDLFLPPGNIQGALARRWWVNAAIDGGTIAVGGTLIAFHGDVEKAKQAGYLDPHSPKFILNPNNGKYFLTIGLPSGTTVGLMPSPIRTPMRIMASPFASAIEDIDSGETNPKAIASGAARSALIGKGDFTGGLGGFVQSRLGAGLRSIPAASEALIQNPTDLPGVAKAFGGGASPLPVSNVVENPPTSLEEAKTAAIESAGKAGGADIRQASAYENLNNYLMSIKNPDGSKRFPKGYSTVKTTTNGLADFLVNDPKASQLVQEYQQSRADNGSQQSKDTLKAQQDRDKSLTEAAQTLANSSDPYRYINYRNTVTKIREQSAEQEKKMALSFATTDPERQTINTWYDLYDAATDKTGALHTDDFTDPVTGEELPGLDSLQAQWKQEHPGQYEALIKPAYEGAVPSVLPDGQPNPERQLRADRDRITDSGWWATANDAWQQTQQALNGKLNGVADLSQYDTEGQYSRDRLSYYEQRLQGQGYSPDVASEYAKIYLQRDPVVRYFGRLRTIARVRLIQQQPDLLAVLDKWGYTTPTKSEIAAAIQGGQ